MACSGEVGRAGQVGCLLVGAEVPYAGRMADLCAAGGGAIGVVDSVIWHPEPGGKCRQGAGAIRR